MREFAINYREINKIIETIIHDEQICSVNSDILLNLFEILEYCLIRKLVFISTRKQLMKIVPRLLDESKFISKKVHKSLEMVSGVRLISILRYQLFGRHPRFFWNVIYLYPKFVADLIDILPELFRNELLEIFESPFFEKEFQYERYGKAIEYIRVFRCLYQLLDERDNSKEMMSRGLHMLERTISEFSRFRETDFSQLTIEQIDDLLWYVDFVGNKRISKEIKEALQQYFRHHRYRGTPFFEKIFS